MTCRTDPAAIEATIAYLHKAKESCTGAADGKSYADFLDAAGYGGGMDRPCGEGRAKRARPENLGTGTKKSVILEPFELGSAGAEPRGRMHGRLSRV